MTTDRITLSDLDARCANVNRRMESRGSDIRYATQGRNGYTGLDRYSAAAEWNMLSTVVCGTKREVGDYLTAMMTALDDSEITEPPHWFNSAEGANA